MLPDFYITIRSFFGVNNEITKLTTIINHYNYNYYVLHKSIVEDSDYDNVFNRLKFLEERYPCFQTVHSPTQKVGYRPKTKPNNIQHGMPMLSLENAFSRLDLEKFYNRIKKITKQNKVLFECELKLDGVAINLLYESINNKENI